MDVAGAQARALPLLLGRPAASLRCTISFSCGSARRSWAAAATTADGEDGGRGYERVAMDTPGAYRLVDRSTGKSVIVWGGVDDGEDPSVPSPAVLSRVTADRSASKGAANGGSSAGVGSFGRLKAQKVQALARRSAAQLKREGTSSRTSIAQRNEPPSADSDEEGNNSGRRKFVPDPARRAKPNGDSRDARTSAVRSLNSVLRQYKGDDDSDFSDEEPASGPKVWGKVADVTSYRREDRKQKVPLDSGFFSRRSFKEIGCGDEILGALRTFGFPQPSHIQAMAYAPVLEGRSCIIADQSGSGKTLAYLCPIVQNLRKEEAMGIHKPSPRNPRVVILTPTAELSSQVLQNCRSISKLSCSGHDTIFDHPVLGSCKVTAIYYMHRVINITPPVEPLAQCPLQKLILKKLETGVYKQPQSFTTMVRCSKSFIPAYPYSIVGPAPCVSSNTSQFWYLALASAYISDLPWDCVAISKGIPIPFSYDKHGPNSDPSNEIAKAVVNFGATTFTWHLNNITGVCQQCEHEGRYCGFSSQKRQAFCQHHGTHAISIAEASSVAAFAVLSMMVVTVIFLSLKSRYDEEINMKVEMFLKAYGTSKPTRYTFRDVKKIARRFKDKLGQGGFGSVYKGELPNGVPVAVKMLESSTGEGEDFINEVATIGLIHHANIVRLLGFCSEGMRRALIYEFMPNESLEKYIFPQVPNISRQLLAPNKMLDIALGIARGMEYLHQGCNQRILHFDIKPHNILLDYNFNPKISDFGLAKLCARDQSIVTLTAARGTMGYIAPELYSRNFGGVSYKSDVYSFGMLVLEMVSGRRNSDPSVGSQNDVYLPEWIYEKVISGQAWELTLEMTEEDKEKIRQLTIVALWCIQWNPKNRPSMTKVVNMLTGRMQNLQIPPKPFVSSENQPRT